MTPHLPGTDKHPQKASIGAGLFSDERLHGWPLIAFYFLSAVVGYGAVIAIGYALMVVVHWLRSL
jgi:hypothetical protein